VTGVSREVSVVDFLHDRNFTTDICIDKHTHMHASSGFCDYDGLLGCKKLCSLVAGRAFAQNMVTICSVKMLAIAH
jgi:hypothetical protein